MVIIVKQQHVMDSFQNIGHHSASIWWWKNTDKCSVKLWDSEQMNTFSTSMFKHLWIILSASQYHICTKNIAWYVDYVVHLDKYTLLWLLTLTFPVDVDFLMFSLKVELWVLHSHPFTADFEMILWYSRPTILEYIYI